MTLYRLSKQLVFPSPENAEPSGLLALGGDLRPERLELAYNSGIFPWYSEGEPLLWWSPNPRFVLFPQEFKLRRSLRKVIAQRKFEIRLDHDFAAVISHCAEQPRPGQDGTWLVPAMRQAYLTLHQRGSAHSVETYLNGTLVGGLYGVAKGPFFFGESMFHLEPDASKVAFACLVEIYRLGVLIDCQIPNPFTITLGAREIPRKQYLELLHTHLQEPDLWPTHVKVM